MSKREPEQSTLNVLYIALAALQSMNSDLRKIGRGRPDDGAHPDCPIEIVRAEIARLERDA